MALLTELSLRIAQWLERSLSLSMSRLNSAAAFALAQISPDRTARLVAMTDGFSTEPLDGLAEKLINQGVPLEGLTTVNIDFMRMYRPQTNVVRRPVAGTSGTGISLVGHHEILIPLIAAAVISAGEGS